MKRSQAQIKTIKKRLDKLIKMAKQDTAVLAVFLFGSVARENNHRKSDLDISLILKQGSYSPTELSQKKLEYLMFTDSDIHIFQQLPLYIRIRVIKEGKVLFCKDVDALYQIVFNAISEFEDFKHIYQDYLKEVSSVR